MDKDKTIAWLNQDIAGEHAAIIQYLTHAYAMGEGEMACEIEAITREEMRHLDWLAETIVELGGVPTLERGKMRSGGQEVADWMANNVRLEEDGIKRYREQIKSIDDPGIRRLLQSILSDEESHRADFQHFVAKSRQEGARDLRGNHQDRTTRILARSIEHEYTVILQYMLHSYMTTNQEVKKKLEDRAINEMQHLGWLSEKMVDIGGHPRIEHTELDQSVATADMLRADLQIEQEVAAEYDSAARETEEPVLKKLFLRIRDHEIYHSEVFSDLLEKESKDQSNDEK
ncbi:MAG: ferritin-like domain-containing protein [Chloroflexi bacterium]|nr:ferritin-like domain-containing protein [Chloroflexota bacterium]